MERPDTIRAYDVVIVGAGPSGAVLAYELAQRSLRVCIIDKASFPRYKPCGGGLPARTTGALPFDISEVVEEAVHSLTFTRKGRDAFTRSYAQPLIYMVSRERFDAYLVKKAAEAGAELIEREEVLAVELERDAGRVRTKGGAVIEGAVVVGADGARSAVAAGLGVDGFEYDTALEAEVPFDDALMREYRGRVLIDWGTFPGGYCWVFPKADHLSIGVGGPTAFNKHYKGMYREWLERNDLSGGQGRIFAHLLKFRLDERLPIAFPRAILVGEAAGLVDVFTGEGLYYAVSSARIAAPVVEEAVRGDIRKLGEYQRAINERLMPELLAAKDLMNLFNLMPGTIHGLFKHSEWMWRYFCLTLRGEKTYIDLRDEASPTRFLPQGLLNAVADRVYRRKVARWKKNR